VFVAKGADGADLSDVRVDADGTLLLERLTGAAVPINPGQHTFTFTWSDKVVERSAVVHEGEKNRILSVEFPADLPNAQPTPVAAAPAKPAPAVAVRKPVERPTPPSVYIAGGLGVVALGGFAYFAASGRSDANALHDDACATSSTCDPDETGAVKDKYLAANIFLGVGIVSFGVATVLWLARPEVMPQTDTANLRVDILPIRDGATATVGGVF
jgi:hypothetical protein